MVNTIHTYNKIHGDNRGHHPACDEDTTPLFSNSKSDKPKERAEWAWILHEGFDDE